MWIPDTVTSEQKTPLPIFFQQQPIPPVRQRNRTRGARGTHIASGVLATAAVICFGLFLYLVIREKPNAWAAMSGSFGFSALATGVIFLELFDNVSRSSSYGIENGG